MPESPRLTKPTRQTTERPQTKSASMLLLATALDTTWRVFLPTLGGLFIGLWIDQLFHIAPVGMIALTLLGILGSGFLIVRQLKDVRKQR